MFGEGVIVWLLFIVPMHSIDEVYNCNHPHYDPKRPDQHLVCNWAEDDFEYLVTEQGRLIHQLKRDCEADNKYEKKARDKFWEEN